VHVRSTAFANWFNAAATLRGHRWFGRDLSATNVTIKVVAGDRMRVRGKGWAAGSVGSNFIYSNRVPVRQLFDWLCADDPDYLQCHPSILQALIHRSRELGAKPARLRDVRSMGEVLEPGLRDLCRREWHVPVRDNYSCEELAIIALSCPRHDHLHIQSERVLVEILDDAGHPCAPGQTGRVVVTGLLNFATPLIRYELVDRAIAGAPCAAIPGLAVIERIVGRERQPVLLPSGDRVFPVLDAEPLLLKGGVRQYQLIQVSRTAMTLKLVADRRLSAPEEDEIRTHLQRNFGHPFAIQFVYVDEIAASRAANTSCSNRISCRTGGRHEHNRRPYRTCAQSPRSPGDRRRRPHYYLPRARPAGRRRRCQSARRRRRRRRSSGRVARGIGRPCACFLWLGARWRHYFFA